MEDKLSQMMLRLESDSPPSPEEIELCYARVVGHALARLEQARDAQDASVYGNLQGMLDDLRNEFRDVVQAMTRKQMWQIIVKLREGGEIDRDELDLIRLWIVGDADAYIREENNFRDWLDEFDRLTEEIRRLRSGPVEIPRIEELRGLLTDTRGVAWSISNYLNDRERVEHFERTISDGITPRERGMLADILARSYNSHAV